MNESEKADQVAHGLDSNKLSTGESQSFDKMSSKNFQLTIF